MVLIVVVLVLFLAVIIGILGLIFYIRSKTRTLSRQLFNNDSLIDGYQAQKAQLSEEPKSVSGMTKIYLPQISNDFPEFHYEEFKRKAQNMLLSAFSSIESEDISLLTDASKDLTTKISLLIEENKNDNKHVTYNNITIHQTEITRYQKYKGTCTITLQSAVGHLYYIEQNQKVIEGDKSLKEQCKYNIDIVYIQDVSKLDSKAQAAFAAAKCPNCGASITNLGSKMCEYCGSPIQTVNIRVWTINDFKKL